VQTILLTNIWIFDLNQNSWSKFQFLNMLINYILLFQSTGCGTLELSGYVESKWSVLCGIS